MQLTELDPVAIRALGRDILNRYRGEPSTFEEISQLLVQELYRFFRTAKGEPEFALLRVFRTMDFKALTPELQSMTKEKSGQFLVLTGSVGVEKDWCNRKHSRTRQIIEISDKMSPMFKGVFHELGFRWGSTSASEVAVGGAVETMSMIRYFHIEDVSSSKIITDQQLFVRPYNIKSIVAAGTQFIGGDAYVIIGFTIVPVTPANAEIFSEITPFISTLLAIFDNPDTLWE
jgi:hypothetical protein